MINKFLEILKRIFRQGAKKQKTADRMIILYDQTKPAVGINCLSPSKTRGEKKPNLTTGTLTVKITYKPNSIEGEPDFTIPTNPILILDSRKGRLVIQTANLKSDIEWTLKIVDSLPPNLFGLPREDLLKKLTEIIFV